MRRTKQALIQALVRLVLEKRYDTITIQDLLDRADVGRSTFYLHYRGKDDLLLRSFERMIEGFDETLDENGAKGRLVPVQELFEHVSEARRFHEALVRARMIDRLYHAGTEVLSRTIARRLAARAQPPEGIAAPVLARALAGALFALLRWWLDEGEPFTPAQMDAMYHAIRS